MKISKKDLSDKHVVVIGAGYTGLAAAYELELRGIRTTVFEQRGQAGGMADTFIVGGMPLECFYHHFFSSDNELIRLIKESGLSERIVNHKALTGMYVHGKFLRLSSPLDVIRFTPLSLIDRIRLGMLILKAKGYKEWQELDNLSAGEWIRLLCGNEVFKVAWEPLLKSKFGEYASEISAAWFWRKITKRGSSRNNRGSEHLLYLKGGFSTLTEQLVKNVSTIYYNEPVEGIEVRNGRIKAVISNNRTLECDAVIATQALPLIVDILNPHVDEQFIKRLNKIDYLANICLVLELEQNLSQMYWINVNDLSFPFVGIIEHTNFESAETYGGKHIVYLSKYLSPDSDIFLLDDEALLNYALPYLKRMFPQCSESWIKNFHVWRAKYAQPVVIRNYRNLIPGKETPVSGFFISTMAQIYPEDRGLNYAVREGRNIACHVERYLCLGKNSRETEYFDQIFDYQNMKI